MTRVIKVGGRPQGDPSLPVAIARNWDAITRPMVVVHGGGDEVTTLQTAFGTAAQFIDGRRVTSAADVEMVRMALSGSANKRLVASLVGEGVRALGLSGEDAALITATPLDAQRFGHVGQPHRINVELLWLLLDGGYLPVLSPVSRNACAGHGGNVPLGDALNVNGDDAASAVAVALAAKELLLVADVPGVMVDGAVVPTLDAHGAAGLLSDGTASGGMRAKLQAALAAVAGGVERVRISDIAAVDDERRGTTLVA
jgi:acetylglutamate kinase